MEQARPSSTKKERKKMWFYIYLYIMESAYNNKE
jgi:hypothetical protein